MSKSLGNVRLADGPDEARMAPTSCASGRSAPTMPRTSASARRSWSGIADAYRRLRNTLRYLLGALAGFGEAERAAGLGDAGARALGAAPAGGAGRARPELQRRLRLPAPLRRPDHQLLRHRSFGLLFRRPQGRALLRPGRTACGAAPRAPCWTTLFDCLDRWLAPVLVFTAEEAWLTRYPGEEGSVHLELFRHLPDAWLDPALAARWERVRECGASSPARSRSSAARSASAPASRRRRPSSGHRGRPRRRSTASTWPSSPSPARIALEVGPAPRAPSPSTRYRAWGGAEAGRGRQMRALLAGPAGGGSGPWGSAGAAPMPSTARPRPDRARRRCRHARSRPARAAAPALVSCSTS